MNSKVVKMYSNRGTQIVTVLSVFSAAWYWIMKKCKKLDNMADTVQKKHNEFHLKVRADGENLDIIRNFITRSATKMGFPEDEIYQIALAADEASANVIEHAYVDEHSKGRNIDVTVKKNLDQIEITIADFGGGFNPDAIKTPNMDEYLKEMKPGGLGVYLIRTLMDEVNYCINPGFYNEIKMVKCLKKSSKTLAIG